MIQASSHRRLMSSTFTIQRKKDFKSATTLLCIAILFIACQSPKIIPDVYEAWNCSYIQVKIIFTELLSKLIDVCIDCE